MFFFQSQIWRVVEPLYWSVTRFQKFHFKIMLLKKHQKCEKCRFHEVTWTKTWFFGWKHFCKKWHVQNFLIQNLTRCSFSIQNLTLRKTFQSKSDAFGNFYFKIWRVRKIEFKIWENIKFLSPKSDFSLVFRVLTEWWYFLSTLTTTFFREEN